MPNRAAKAALLKPSQIREEQIDIINGSFCA
jgi:hypothetical protein